MRDIIWTIIVVWVIWRLIDAFKGVSATRRTQSSTVNNQYQQQNHSTASQTNIPKKGELKSDAGEYVDFEEVK